MQPEDERVWRRYARLRRQALETNGCGTYMVKVFVEVEADGKTETESRGILCLCCGLESLNINDVEQKYCAFCGSYHSEWEVKPEAPPSALRSKELLLS